MIALHAHWPRWRAGRSSLRLCSAAARAAAPVVVAVVCANCAASHFTTMVSHISMNWMMRSPRIFLNACDQLVVPARSPRSCELNAVSIEPSDGSPHLLLLRDRLLVEADHVGTVLLLQLGDFD